MSFKVTVLDSLKNVDEQSNLDQFASDVLTGLSKPEKSLSSKYFYDNKGGELFSAITKMPSYYPTRTENDILNKHFQVLSDAMPKDFFNLIELGAGDGQKILPIIQKLKKNKVNFRYVPIDIDLNTLEKLSEKVSTECDIDVHGVGGEYLPALKWIHSHFHEANVLFFLGSNIGNFNPTEAEVFLRQIWYQLRNDDSLLIGFDMKKDIHRLIAAYDDPEGITRSFNLNLLTRMNRELGADFDIDKWEHHGTYNPRQGAMESFIISKEHQNVYIERLQKRFHFKAFEAIHMEYSYKYLLQDIAFLAENCGYELWENLRDAQGWFTDSLWRVKKQQKH